MGRPTSLLISRWGAALGLFALLAVYFELATHLWRTTVWWDVAWLGFVLMPATFALVLLTLPLRGARGLLPVGLAFALLAAVLTYANIDVFANFARLGACTFIGWWFLGYFETVSWVVLVASIIPWVDAYSVWRGPTKTIVEHHENIFNVLSFAFTIPGTKIPLGLRVAEHAIAAGQPLSENGLGQHFGLVPFSTGASLGVPDLLFFALFLAAAARFGLRVFATWVCLVAALGLTIAATVWFDLSGLPALPGIALGFLLPNADLLWTELRRPKEPRPVPGTG